VQGRSQTKFFLFSSEAALPQEREKSTNPLASHVAFSLAQLERCFIIAGVFGPLRVLREKGRGGGSEGGGWEGGRCGLILLYL
jgi:hypothetical protein